MKVKNGSGVKWREERTRIPKERKIIILNIIPRVSPGAKNAVDQWV